MHGLEPCWPVTVLYFVAYVCSQALTHAFSIYGTLQELPHHILKEHINLHRETFTQQSKTKKSDKEMFYTTADNCRGDQYHNDSI